MAAPTAQPTETASEYDTDAEIRSVTALSDYGSDIGLEDIDEVTILANVLNAIKEVKPADRSRILPSIEFEEGEREDQNEDGFVHIHQPTVLRVAQGKRRTTKQVDTLRYIQSSPPREPGALEVVHDQISRQSWSVPLEASSSPSRTSPRPPRYNLSSGVSQAERSIQNIQAVDPAENDTVSPLERFRTKPKKPLSVTDLVSPAWCELQYFYTLSKFGRKPRTQAMRNGSRIHQKLEDEVHTTVPVQVQSKEDRFGLRIWNTVSGLRCLRETGLTRELEVWGVVEGQVVNGVIDELSYECPDPAFEEQVERARAEKDSVAIPLPPPPGQITISQAFSKATSHSENNAWIGRIEPNRQVYISDVKTRSVRSVPAGASLRPTWMQLMIYRKLLESLSLNTVDAETVFARYDVQPLEPFTSIFLDAIGGLGPVDEVLNYPNLLSVWALLITEMQTTLPPTSLSPILRAEFRYAKTGDVVGSELILYETAIIDRYIAEEMAWWKGSRQAKGVEMEEAFKCRICDFAEDCTWRKTKVEEATEKSRLRRLAREKSAV